MLANWDDGAGSAAEAPQLRLSHFSHERFHEQLRKDLEDASTRVLLYSPFVAQSRVNYYIDLLSWLAARGVALDVYAKPKHEQPEQLQHQFDVVSQRLELAGVHLHLRPLMHEKIAIVDDAVLWHGSLNILSHSSSIESMLRFESADLVKLLMAELGLVPADAGERAPAGEEAQDEARAPACPRCAAPMRLYPDLGLWICANSPTCAGTLPVQDDQAARAPAVETLSLSCPVCGSPLQVRRSFTTRLECSDAGCSFSVDPRLTAGILRVLRRRARS